MNIGIISSDDGPTSVLFNEKETKSSFKAMVDKCRFKYNRKKVEKRLQKSNVSGQESKYYIPI